MIFNGKNIFALRRRNEASDRATDTGLRIEAVTREPVAYLYNVVRLPKLPEWDKTEYPYAMISNEVLNSVVFTAYAERPSTNMATIVNPYDTDIPLVHSFLSTDGKSWGELTEGRLGTEGQNSLPFWANFDVIHGDGTTYLAASEPVPVYE